MWEKTGEPFLARFTELDIHLSFLPGAESAQGKYDLFYKLNRKTEDPITREHIMHANRSFFLLFGLLMLSGCITEATLELTKAPFDATTALTDGTSKAVGEILEPTQKFLSSTTPGTIAIDRFTRAREKTELFVGYSYEHLRAESVRGTGEHLASLAVLAGVPPDRHSLFQDNMRDAYSTIFNESLPAREAKLRLVNAAWSEGFGKLESETMKHQETGIADMDLRLGKPRNTAALMSQR